MKCIMQVTYHKISDSDFYKLEYIGDIEEIFICDTYGEKELMSTEIIERWEDIILDNIDQTKLKFNEVYQTTLKFSMVVMKYPYREFDEGDDIQRSDHLLSHKKIGNYVGDELQYDDNYKDINN